MTLGYADGHGARSAAGALLALQAAGSCAAALALTAALLLVRAPDPASGAGPAPDMTQAPVS